jgi:hypothetical protein
MKFTFEVTTAKTLTLSLQGALAFRQITLVHDQALAVLAQLQGAHDWNALAATLSPAAIEAQLSDHERGHLRLNKDVVHGPEQGRRAQSGFILRYSHAPDRCNDLRVIDPLGRQIAYCSAQEWQEDPQKVMLEIFSALVRAEHHTELRTKSEVIDSPVPKGFERPLTIYVRTYCSAEDAPRPEWAKIEVDAKLQSTLAELEDILRRGKLSEAQRQGDPCWAHERNDDLCCRMDPGRLVVSDLNSFRYQARPRHGNYLVETRDVYFEALHRALNGPSEVTCFDYLRRGAIVIYDDAPHDLLQTLLEDDEKLEGFTTEEHAVDHE